MAKSLTKRIFTSSASWVPDVACKVCDADSPLYGVVDFNKSCEEARGKFLPLLGEPVYYHQCSACKLVFTVDFDGWSKQRFMDEIYNDEYVFVDPDYLEARPAANAEMIAGFLKGNRNISILDYGGGNGRLAAAMKAQGFAATSWDPMNDSDVRPQGSRFKLITAFEVMEHTPQPLETFSEMTGFLDDDGAILFSTLTIDALSPRNVGFWYISPRNGHVTIYTRQSLEILANDLFMQVHHFNDGLHLAYRTPPTWLT